MPLTERIHLLQGMPFFGAVSDSSVTLILEHSETLHVKEGEYFFNQGESGDSLFILEQGHAIIFKQAEAGGKEYIIRDAKSGDCFGDLALIDFSPRSASVRATSDCVAIRIPSSTLHILYEKDPEQFILIQMNMSREVSRRLRLSDERWFQMQVASSSNHSI